MARRRKFGLRWVPKGGARADDHPSNATGVVAQDTLEVIAKPTNTLMAENPRSTRNVA